MHVGQNPVPVVNIPIPTRIGSKMDGEFTYQPKWDPIGFEPWPYGWVSLSRVGLLRRFGRGKGYAVSSYRRAAEAWKRGAMDAEVAPLRVKNPAQDSFQLAQSFSWPIWWHLAACFFVLFLFFAFCFFHLFCFRWCFLLWLPLVFVIGFVCCFSFFLLGGGGGWGFPLLLSWGEVPTKGGLPRGIWRSSPWNCGGGGVATLRILIYIYVGLHLTAP